MKKINIIFLFSLLFILSAIASEKAKNKFSCMISPSLALYSADQWWHIPANRPPLIALATKVVRKEYFEIAVYFSNFSYKVGDQGIDYHITIKKPDGAVYYKSQQMHFPLNGKTVKLTPHSIYRANNALRVCFEPNDPDGQYTFNLQAVNKSNGQKASATSSLTLVSWAAIQKEFVNINADSVMKKITFYYKNPQPSSLPRLFDKFLIVDQRLRKIKKNYSPYNILSFFYTILKDNKFLIKYFAAKYNSYNSFGKQYMLILLSALGNEGKLAIGKLNKNAQKYATRLASKPNPFIFNQVTNPTQADILWSQFFATGAFAPIEKLVKAMQAMKNGMTIKKFKTIKKPTISDKQQLMKFLTGMSAQWSLTQNVKTHATVKFYCESILQRSHDQYIIQKLKKIITGKFNPNKIGLSHKNK